MQTTVYMEILTVTLIWRFGDLEAYRQIKMTPNNQYTRAPVSIYTMLQHTDEGFAKLT